LVGKSAEQKKADLAIGLFCFRVLGKL